MDYRPFGRTGLEVSSVGFGCWEMGGGYGSIEESEAIAAVHRAVDLGINLFDTAEAYGFGLSEELLAKALGDRREQIILVTKFGVAYDNDRPRGADGTPERIRESIEGSLRALKTDYVDVYLVHWPDRKTPFDVTFRALEDVVQEGKARFIGLCNFKPTELGAAMAARRLDVVQYPYHILDRRMAEWIFPYVQEHGLGLMPFGTLAYGLLTGGVSEETTFGDGDWRSMGGQDFALWLFARDLMPRNARMVREFGDVARRCGMTLPQLAIRWSTAHAAVSVALVGARRPSEVEDNVRAFDAELPSEAFEEIESILAEYEINTAPNKWLEREDVRDEAPPWHDASRSWARNSSGDDVQ